MPAQQDVDATRRTRPKRCMLVLHVSRAYPWVDSSTSVRSPYEVFRLLAPEAREALERGEQAFSAWRIGILSDAWDPPDSAKPVELGGEHGELDATARGYALGDQAQHYISELGPVLREILGTILHGSKRIRCFAADSLWRPEATLKTPFNERLGDFQQLVTPALGRDKTAFRAPEGSRFSTACLDPGALERILTIWWPSPLGAFDIVVPNSGWAMETDERTSVTGVLDIEALGGVDQLVSSSDGFFDNLGFDVLSRQRHFKSALKRLSRRGWSDGVPVWSLSI